MFIVPLVKQLADSGQVEKLDPGRNATNRINRLSDDCLWEV